MEQPTRRPRRDCGPRRPASRLTPLARGAVAVALLQGVVLVLTSTRYGYHRDELYFIVAGSHPAFGYPDQPALVPLLSWAMHSAAPGSLLLLRLPSAVAAAATTVLAAALAREIGGGRRAQIVAASCTSVSGFALAVGHITSTTTFDMLSTTAFLWLVVRAVERRSDASLLAAGIVAGAGFEAKPQVGIVAIACLVAVAAIGPRWVLRSRGSLAGAAAAILIAAPYLIWQQLHGWPQVTVAGNVAGSAEGGRLGFIPFQLVLVSPVLVPVWVAGLLAPFRRPGLRGVRFLPVAYVLLALAYLVGNGKAYYLASLYPALLGLGALPVGDWSLRARRNLATLTAAIVVSAAVSCVLALPLRSATSLQGSVTMKLNPDIGEEVGWPRFVGTVAGAWSGIPAAERARTAIFTANYGEAGAIDILGRARGLPRAYSGHNGYSEWGRPPARDTHALLLGYDGSRDAGPYFRHCRRLAGIDNGVGLDNDEQHLPVLLCRPSASWTTLWPLLRSYG